MDVFCEKTRRVFCPVFLAALAASGAGCSTLLRRVPAQPRSELTLPAGPTATQAGDIAAGAKIAARTLETVLPIPAGSIVALTPPDPAAEGKSTATVTLAAASTLTTRETRQEATGATSHAPPAPPTPAELATGAGVRLFYWLAAGSALLAIALFYFGHAKAAIVALAAAAGLPMLAQVSTVIASHTAIAAGAIVIALVAAWEMLKHRVPDEKNPS